MVKFLGCDISLNHGAVVMADLACPASETQVFFFTDKAKYAKQSGGTLIKKKKQTDKDADVVAVNRLADIKVWLMDVLTNAHVTYAAIEGYAFSMQNQAHQLGEVGGTLRLILATNMIPYRVHDPSSLKMFVTGKGNAEKHEVVDCSIKQFELPKPEHSKLEPRTQEDIADATTLMHMCKTEYLLRSGEMQMKELSAHQIQVFNRVTKSNPVNTLARNWTRLI